MSTLSKKKKEVVDLAMAGGTAKELVILKAVHELEDKFDTVVTEVKGEIPSINDLVGAVKGIQGDQGPKGDAGNQGERGLTGPQGIRGSKGDTGGKGDRGIQGEPGLPGTSGLDAPAVDEEAILSRIELLLPELGARIRDGLELLMGEERLDISAIKGLPELQDTVNRGAKTGWGAHPLMIQGSGVIKDKVARTINFTGSVTVTRTPSGVVTVNVAGGSFSILTPTAGVVNGVNTVFTFASAPSVIALDNGNFMNKVSSDGTVNWTGTTTITLNQAPSFNIFGF